MNTKFFFSAIALFAITSVANARPIGRDGKPRLNKEVATSAVIKGVESKSGMEVAIFGSGIKRASDTEKPMEVAYIYNPLRH